VLATVGLGVGAGVAGVGVGVGVTVAVGVGLGVGVCGLVAAPITARLNKLPAPISSLRPMDIVFSKVLGLMMRLS